MGDIAELMRHAMISPKQAAKRGLMKKTKAQPSKMAEFDGKDGERDQGGVRDRGDPDAGARHIDRKQDMGSPARASGKPASTVPGSQKQPVTRDQIDDADTQAPANPRLGKDSNSRKVGVSGPPPKSSGPQYGGPATRGKYV